MSVIQFSAAISSSTTQATQTAQKQCKDSQATSFDALLSIFSSDSNSTSQSSSASNASGSQGQAGSLDSIFSVLLSENSAASSTDSSSFSSDFQSSFGNSGPLVDFMNMITKQLHLTASQNQALQHIAVENKDATQSGASVQTIAAELTTAGIG